MIELKVIHDIDGREGSFRGGESEEERKKEKDIRSTLYIEISIQ